MKLGMRLAMGLVNRLGMRLGARLARLPQPHPAALLRWTDGSPWRWLAVLAAASPWVRIDWLRTDGGPLPLYPLHILLTLLLAWALIGTQRRALADEVPLLPAVALIAWLALVALFRGQWWALGGTLLGGAFLWVWGWAASAVGRQASGPRHFPEAALLFLAATLLLGVTAWALQWWAPDLCRVVNCDPRAGIPYPFRGGWHTNAQYALVLILLLPFCADPLLRTLRDPRPGRARIALLALTVAAGLALLAGARWWLLGVVALGEVLFARVLAADRHPLDRLFVRGMVFFTLFGAVALYGLAPGYLGPLLTGRGDSRSAGVQVPPGGGAAVLSSDRVTAVPIRLLNTGWSDLRAGDERPLTVSALLLFTPRTGQTRAYPGGELLLYQTVAPGDALDIQVPVRLPHWVNTGFVMWQLHDAAGARIPINAGSRGFRFANASYYSLDQASENQLTALASRARAFATRAQPPPADPVELTGDGLLGNAFDAIFFSPLWGHGPADTPGADNGRPINAGAGPLNVHQSVWLQLLHGYGLVGLGLAAWFGLRVLRQSWQLAQSHERGQRGSSTGSRMAWRLLPVSVVLLAALAMLSGEPARYHSLWGCFLLSGFVEGAHTRLHPNAPRLRLMVPDPRWLRLGWDRLRGAASGWRGSRLLGSRLLGSRARPGPPPARRTRFRLPRFGAFKMGVPKVRMPRLGLPRLRLASHWPARWPRPWPRIRLRRARSPLYPAGAGRRLPRVDWPKLRWPRFRWTRLRWTPGRRNRTPPTSTPTRRRR
jgi:hypothetical protein